MTLIDLSKNQKAIITKCQKNELPLKLIEMSCVEGVEITFINRAPFGALYYNML